MTTIYDLLTPEIIASQFEENYQDTLPSFCSEVFGDRETTNLSIEFLKGSKGLSAMTRLSAYDADYTFLNRSGFKNAMAEMPFFREAMALTEKDRRQINALLAQSLDSQVSAALAKVYEDDAELIRRGMNTREYIGYQLLQTGGVVLATVRDGANASYEITYDDAAETWATNNIIDVLTPWENASANPVNDLISTIAAIRRDHGVVIASAKLSPRLEAALLSNPNVQSMLFPDRPYEYVGQIDIQNYLNIKIPGGLTILWSSSYRQSYLSEATGTSADYHDPNRIILLPAGQVGNFYWGFTPTEDRAAEKPDIQYQVVAPHIVIESYASDKPPYNYETICSFSVMGSFEQMDKVFNIEVPPVTP